MTEKLEARLRTLEETHRAVSILPKYARAVDAANLDAVAALFSENAVLKSPAGDFTGVSAIRGFFTEAWKADPSRKRHFVTNIEPTWITPGRVAIDAYFLHTGRTRRDSVIGWGSYRVVVDVTDQPVFVDVTIGVEVGTDLAHGWADDSEQETSR